MKCINKNFTVTKGGFQSREKESKLRQYYLYKSQNLSLLTNKEIVYVFVCLYVRVLILQYNVIYMINFTLVVVYSLSL